MGEQRKCFSANHVLAARRSRTMSAERPVCVPACVPAWVREEGGPAGMALRRALALALGCLAVLVAWTAPGVGGQKKKEVSGGPSPARPGASGRALRLASVPQSMCRVPRRAGGLRPAGRSSSGVGLAGWLLCCC